MAHWNLFSYLGYNNRESTSVDLTKLGASANASANASPTMGLEDPLLIIESPSTDHSYQSRVPSPVNLSTPMPFKQLASCENYQPPHLSLPVPSTSIHYPSTYCVPKLHKRPRPREFDESVVFLSAKRGFELESHEPRSPEPRSPGPRSPETRPKKGVWRHLKKYFFSCCCQSNCD